MNNSSSLFSHSAVFLAFEMVPFTESKWLSDWSVGVVRVRCSRTLRIMAQKCHSLLRALRLAANLPLWLRAAVVSSPASIVEIMSSRSQTPE